MANTKKQPKRFWQFLKKGNVSYQQLTLLYRRKCAEVARLRAALDAVKQAVNRVK